MAFKQKKLAGIDDLDSTASTLKPPEKTFSALMSEGDKYFSENLFSKAIESYTEALEIEPYNKNALVERSTAYLKVGNYNLAMQDADAAIKEDKEFVKGLLRKAETLYAKGEFEAALIYYYRGKKLRSDLREFQLGINKCQEVIENFVGDPEQVKLQLTGDLAFFEQPDEEEKLRRKTAQFMPRPQITFQNKKREKRKANPHSQRTVKQLLDELYADRVYLDKLLEDNLITKENTKSGDAIYNLVNKSLDFLESRTEFWRQIKPINAKKAREDLKKEQDDAVKNPTPYITQQLELINILQNNGKYFESLRKCENLLGFVNKQSNDALDDKQRVVSSIYSNMGNSYLESGKYDLAVIFHNKDLNLSRDLNNKEDESRALENLGRVYARSGRFKEAIEVWEKKLPLVTTNLDKAWLYHEIGRCYLELNNSSKAEENGEKSYEAAVEVNDETWKLNSTVLIAQAQAKVGDIDSLTDAIGNFEKALDMVSKQKDDTATEKEIRKGYNYCKDRLQKLIANQNPEIAYKIEINKSPDNVPTENDNLILSMYGNRGDLESIELASLAASKPGDVDVERYEVSGKSDIGRIKRIVIKREVPSPDNSIKIDWIRIVKDDRVEYLFNVSKAFDPNDIINTIEIVPNKTTYLSAPKVKPLVISKKESSTATDNYEQSEFEADEVDEAKTMEARSQPPTDSSRPNAESVDKLELEDGFSNQVAVSNVQQLNAVNNGKDTARSKQGGKESSRSQPKSSAVQSSRHPVSQHVSKASGKPSSGLTLTSRSHVDAKKNVVQPSAEQKPKPSAAEQQSKTDSNAKPLASKPLTKTLKDDSNKRPNVESTTEKLTGRSKSADTKSAEDAANQLNPEKKALSDDELNKTIAEKSLNESQTNPVVVVDDSPKNINDSVSSELERIKSVTPKQETPLVTSPEKPFNTVQNLANVVPLTVANQSTPIPSSAKPTSKTSQYAIESNAKKDIEAVKAESVEAKTVADNHEEDEDAEKVSTLSTYKVYDESEEEEEAPKKLTDVQKQKTIYVVTVYTGDVFGAGTDSDVFIKIFGKYGETPKIELTDSLADNFEQGNVDIFKIKAFNVGEITKINMSQDNSGAGPAWYLKKVTVTNKSDNKTYEFPCKRWLDAKAGDHKTDIDLLPSTV